MTTAKHNKYKYIYINVKIATFNNITEYLGVDVCIQTLLPYLHGAKIFWTAIKSRSLHGTFIVQYKKVHHIVVHCSVIVTLQST